MVSQQRSKQLKPYIPMLNVSLGVIKLNLTEHNSILTYTFFWPLVQITFLDGFCDWNKQAMFGFTSEKMPTSPGAINASVGQRIILNRRKKLIPFSIYRICIWQIKCRIQLLIQLEK